MACDGDVRVVALSGASFAADAPELKGDKEKLSYSIGMDIGGNLKRGSVEVDPDMLGERVEGQLRRRKNPSHRGRGAPDDRGPSRRR